jgi:hypothetical protein
MKLSEDWLATIIGLVIVAVIGLGLFGPGPLEFTLSAEPGEQTQTEGEAANGWSVSAALNGERTSIQQPEGEDFARLGAQTTYRFHCVEGIISADPPAFDSASYEVQPPPMVVLDNACDVPVTLSYRRPYAIRWPLFDLFAR